jgi:hypothetical protein
MYARLATLSTLFAQGTLQKANNEAKRNAKCMRQPTTLPVVLSYDHSSKIVIASIINHQSIKQQQARTGVVICSSPYSLETVCQHATKKHYRTALFFFFSLLATTINPT